MCNCQNFEVRKKTSNVCFYYNVGGGETCVNHIIILGFTKVSFTINKTSGGKFQGVALSVAAFSTTRLADFSSVTGCSTSEVTGCKGSTLTSSTGSMLVGFRI